jgi:hypothetical protein
MLSLLSFLKRKRELTGQPCSVCVCPTFYSGKDDRFSPICYLLLMMGSPTSSVQFPIVVKNNVVVAQKYEGAATQCL